MTETKYEEAKRCPKCKNPGRHSSTTRVKSQGVWCKVETYTCERELCLGYGLGWVVQVMPDGTIPEFKRGPKQYELDVYALNKGRRMLEEVEAEIQLGDPNR